MSRSYIVNWGQFLIPPREEIWTPGVKLARRDEDYPFAPQFF
jgi:hypothetical protein